MRIRYLLFIRGAELAKAKVTLLAKRRLRRLRKKGPRLMAQARRKGIRWPRGRR
jgi:hypothetical protein